VYVAAENGGHTHLSAAAVPRALAPEPSRGWRETLFLVPTLAASMSLPPRSATGGAAALPRLARGTERARQPRASNPNRERAAVLRSASQLLRLAAVPRGGGNGSLHFAAGGRRVDASRCQLLAAAPHRSRGVPLPEHRERSPVCARESSGDSEQSRAAANSPEECVVHRTGE